MLRNGGRERSSSMGSGMMADPAEPAPSKSQLSTHADFSPVMGHPATSTERERERERKRERRIKTSDTNLQATLSTPESAPEPCTLIL